MSRFRSYILPIAIILGLIFHGFCGKYAYLAPYFVFAILILNFVAIDLRKLHISKLNYIIMFFQIVISLAAYFTVHYLFKNEVVAQAVLIGILCPVAASIVVISTMLGADRETVTAYTIVGNIMVAVVAPIYFSFIGQQQDMPFWTSFFLVFKKIGPVIGLPFFIALLIQVTFPRIGSYLSRFKDYTFYLWAVALFLALGQTINYVSNHGRGNAKVILLLGLASALVCCFHYGIGKLIGKKYGDSMAGGQMLGQKNTAVGMWMSNTYLLPMAAVFLAFYSIWQNLFNSWQLWMHDKNNLSDKR
ncbi:MAG: hypothetical protein PHW85_05325 [Bacteroidales bacterium]|nr:hypothetical protein [Bacteroidales bacterium]MDD4420984.1 hypothetical protein [Bacteroidales bacterium]